MLIIVVTALIVVFPVFLSKLGKYIFKSLRRNVELLVNIGLQYQAAPIKIQAGAGTQRVFQPIQQGIHEFPADVNLPGWGMCGVLIVPVKLSQISHQGHHLMRHAVAIHRIPQITPGVKKKGLELLRLKLGAIEIEHHVLPTVF